MAGIFTPISPAASQPTSEGRRLPYSPANLDGHAEMTHFCAPMVNLSQTGEQGLRDRTIREFSARLRSDEFLAEFYDMVESGTAVEVIFSCVMRNMREARFTVRAPDKSSPKGWRYEWVPDGAVQLAAARLMAQIMRLTPTIGGVTVDARTQTVNVTATERLAELDSLGVPREMVARACEDLLAVAKGGEGAAGKSDSPADLH